MTDFQLVSNFDPMGDQPTAIAGLVDGLNNGLAEQVLLGATGTGKTFTIANVIQQTQRPTLILAHNKTLAAQLYAEFKSFFPHNAVSYFVSYYDYYQPEAYIPRTDTYIEKTTEVNAEIERMRLAATQALATRRDVIVIASVSAIYSLGNPVKYHQAHVQFCVGEVARRDKTLRRLVDIYYERNDFDLAYNTFRVKGSVLEIRPSYADNAYRIEFWGDEVERITEIDPTTGEVVANLEVLMIHPARHFVTNEEDVETAVTLIEAELEERLDALHRDDKLLEAYRLEQRTRYDIEMLREVGYCQGSENYTRHFYNRPQGAPPWTLLDYFPDDFLLVVDESHMTIPQVRAMYHGDRNRKQTLVDYGFRLPSALDNRPLTFAEWEERIYQVIYTSATPSSYELGRAEHIVEQIIRPTGLMDPQVLVRPIKGQVDDLLFEVKQRVAQGQRALITTLTKRMAEDLAAYLSEMNLSVHYLHSEVETLERVDILQDLRRGVYDAVVGINLLREGLDLPEVSLVAILDADKEGFLRSDTALVQTIGRAARHVAGTVIMYADRVTASMQRALDETNRRRARQLAYNEAHGISPRTIEKGIDDGRWMKGEAAEATPSVAEPLPTYETADLLAHLDELETAMRSAAQALEFERAAQIRDRIAALRDQLVPVSA
ncbi:MAG: excinuclease ABC subunit UvrB [Ardenticatenaceae bacterium]|nr:excinuclease ABC subunit UvrB [Ardenticatenaceae bacterium]